MKNRNIIFSMFMIPILFLCVILCFSLRDSDSEDITSVLLSKNNLVFSGVGETEELSATVVKNGVNVNLPASSSNILWTSTDTSVAVVENGLVTSVGYGSCVIRASQDSYSSFCTVSNPNPNPPFSISHDEIILDNIGASRTVYAISDIGEDISSKASWRSSNENIAVCEDGVITAVGYGSCTISAVYSRKSIACIVTVSNPSKPSITLSKNNLSLKSGEEYILNTQTENDAGKVISWKSTDDGVAVCADGVVTAKGNGTCAIVVMTELGYTDLCIVTVGDKANKIGHSDLLRFDLPDIGKELNFIDKTTGTLQSSIIVIDYNVKTLLLADGRLVVELSLVCVKTYDKDGFSGNNSATVTATLYRENDVFCDKKIYRTENVQLGETFTVKCSGFTVQTKTDGAARELYMTFATITER